MPIDRRSRNAERRRHILRGSARNLSLIVGYVMGFISAIRSPLEGKPFFAEPSLRLGVNVTWVGGPPIW